MAPKGIRNRDWSGTTEPLPAWQPPPAKRVGRGKRKRQRRKAARRARKALGSLRVRASQPILPPPQPWHAAVPPWLDSPEGAAAPPDARQRAAGQLDLYHDIETIAAELASGVPIEAIAERYGVTVEDARRFVTINLSGHSPWTRQGPSRKIPHPTSRQEMQT
jgi:hypothetical protein